MATNEPTLLTMLLRPQSAAPNSQTRTDASRDAQMFNDSLSSAYRDQRNSRPDASAQAASRLDSKRQSSQRLSSNDTQASTHLEQKNRTSDRGSLRSEPREHLTTRQKDTLNRLEPPQREAIEALEPEKQAKVLDELADMAENGLSSDSLNALLEQLDPQLRQQLMGLLQSLTAQAAAGADTEDLLAQIDQAAEAGQIPPELVAWLGDKLKTGSQSISQNPELLAAKLDALQASLKQALASGGFSAGQTPPGVSVSQDTSAVVTMDQSSKSAIFNKDTLLSLDAQREQGTLLETTKLHNLLTGRGESQERPTAASITALTESLGLASRAPTAAAGTRAVPPMLPGFNQSGWGDAVGQKVIWMAKQNITSADMRLDPPDLGTIHVRVTIQNDQAHVSFSSPQSVVREALDQHSARLREMLTEQGMVSVDVDVSDQRSFAGSESQAGEEQDSKHSDKAMAANGERLADADMASSHSLTQLGTVSLIDHYA